MIFSDWRNIKNLDYSSNAVVANWYSGGHSKYFRNEYLKEVMEKVNRGDTLKVGLDYYYLSPVSLHLNVDIPAVASLRLQNDDVITIKVFKENGKIHFLEFQD